MNFEYQENVKPVRGNVYFRAVTLRSLGILNKPTTMVFRDRKLIEKDYLHKWLTREVVSCYSPGLDSFEFGGRQRIVKLLKV